MLRGARVWFVACASVAAIAGVVAAALRAWTCDDAFITFRYAEQLIHGNGLVFNPGERVEGYTNLLWTLWSALGLAFGAAPEIWTGVASIACFAATLGLLARRGWAIQRAAGVAWPIPIAVVLAATHREWTVFATSGLETSAFTLFAFAGYLLISDPQPAPRRVAGGGALLALAALTRPDGVIFASVCGVYVLLQRDRRTTLAFVAGFAVLWLPVTIWRVVYYGSFVPNTYYAKSAMTAWWGQGWFYAKIYFARYWPLVLALPCVFWVRPRRAITLELALAVVYALCVIRVGGDFMFGRLLVPITPFLLVALERGIAALLANRPIVRAVIAAVLAIGMVITPAAVDRHDRPRGIADERDAYTSVLAGWAERADGNGAILEKLFAGLPITVCFFGAQARLIYRSRVATAIECETGLTDATIAHQALAARGRVGHEKHAQLEYLLARHVDFVLTQQWANEVLHLDEQLPDVPIVLGKIHGRVISWDPAIMAALAARGVQVPDVPGRIDRYVADPTERAAAELERMYVRYRRLYFDRVADPVRDAAFRARLVKASQTEPGAK